MNNSTQLRVGKKIYFDNTERIRITSIDDDFVYFSWQTGLSQHETKHREPIDEFNDWIIQLKSLN